jgi:hypothetical protein
MAVYTKELTYLVLGLAKPHTKSFTLPLLKMLQVR